MKKFEIKNNDNGIGVKILGVNISTDLNAQLIVQIQALLNRYKVVCFSNQSLTDQQLEEFAFRFGPPFVPDNNFPVLGSEDKNSSIVVVGNQAHEFKKSYLGNQEVLPHSDHQWLRCPSAASLLYAVEIHHGSSPTYWYDMEQSYDSLDSITKNAVDNIQAITYNPFFRPFGSLNSKYVNRSLDVPPGETFAHPLVRTHPVTHHKILYLNVAYELEFVGMQYEDGVELFSTLTNHILNHTPVYMHNWEEGDLVMWDNRATIHYRPQFASEVKRVLKRVTIAGEIPF